MWDFQNFDAKWLIILEEPVEQLLKTLPYQYVQILTSRCNCRFKFFCKKTFKDKTTISDVCWLSLFVCWLSLFRCVLDNIFVWLISEKNKRRFSKCMIAVILNKYVILLQQIPWTFSSNLSNHFRENIFCRND